MGKFIDFLLAKPKQSYPYTDSLVEVSTKQKMESNHSLVIEEIHKLKTFLATAPKNDGNEYKGISWFNEYCVDKGISQTVKSNFLSTIHNESTIAQLNDIAYIKKRLHNYFIDKIKLYVQKPQKNKQRLIILVGTTGIGKTTAMYKLISHFGQASAKACTIRLASLDNQRPGTKEYLEKINAYTGIQGEVFFNQEDFRNYVRKGTRPETLIVDTAGNNPKNKKELLAIAQSLDPFLEKGEVFLVLPANISQNDIRHILDEFSLLRYDGIIITKMDEAISPSAALSVCIEKSVPIAFISDGKELLGNFTKVEYEILLNYFNIV